MLRVFLLASILLMTAGDFAYSQVDSSHSNPEKTAYVAPIQIVTGVGVYSVVFLGIFGRGDLLDSSMKADDIGGGFAMLASGTITGVLVHVVGNVILDSNVAYMGLTTLGGILGGFMTWDIMPKTSGNWRILDRAIPPTLCATLAYTLQSLFLPESPVRINPIIGRFSGLSLEVSY